MFNEIDENSVDKAAASAHNLLESSFIQKELDSEYQQAIVKQKEAAIPESRVENEKPDFEVIFNEIGKMSCTEMPELHALLEKMQKNAASGELNYQQGETDAADGIQHTDHVENTQNKIPLEPSVTIVHGSDVIQHASETIGLHQRAENRQNGVDPTVPMIHGIGHGNAPGFKPSVTIVQEMSIDETIPGHHGAVGTKAGQQFLFERTLEPVQ